jgi:hypothetical protein
VFGRFRQRQGEGTKAATCPYCRAGLLAGEPSTACPRCETEHHAECYRENGGCTVFGCAGAGDEGRELAPATGRWKRIAFGVAIAALLTVGGYALARQEASERAARAKGEDHSINASLDADREVMLRRLASYLIFHTSEDLAIARMHFRGLVRERGRDPKEVAEEIRKEMAIRVPRASRELLDEVLASLPE